MTITDRDRRNLYEGLESALGPDPADTLMQLLPNQPANELATSNQLSSSMLLLGSELRSEMADLRGELRSEMASLHVDVGKQLSNAEARMTRWAVTVTAANLIGMITAIIV